MDVDSTFKLIGEFGPYQKRIYCLLCLMPFIVTIHTFLSSFILATPKHRCALPGWSNDTYKIQSEVHRQLVNRSIPPSADKHYLYSQCQVFGANNSLISCDRWVYDKTVFHSTFASEYNLVCKNAMLTSHASTIFFGGGLVGAFIVGNLADYIGRKKTMYLSVWTLLISSMALAWTPHYWLYCVLRFIIGVCTSGLYLTPFVLGKELVGPSKRVLAGIVVWYFGSVGMVLLDVLGYFIRDWKYLEIAVSAPVIIFLPYWWILPESPRWLITQGKNKEAEKVIRKIAISNNKTVPENAFTNLEVDSPETGHLLHLFSSRILLQRTLVILINWFCISLGYFGLSLNTGNLSGNFYINFALSGLAEFPAYTICLLLLDKVGRKKLYVSSMLLGGLACLCTIFTMLYLEKDLQPITTALAMLGKVGLSSAYAIAYVWSAELYPTVVRSAGLGLSSTIANAGAMISPYIADISKVIDGDLGRALPLVIFGSCSVLAGLLALTLPETLNERMPETIADGKQLKRKESKYTPEKTYTNKGFTADDNMANGTTSSRL